MDCRRQSELELLAKLEEKNRALFSDAKVVPSLHTRRREGSISSSISTGSGQDDTRSNGTTSLQLNGHSTHGSSKSSNTSGVSIPLMIGWTAGAPIISSIREQWDYLINNWDQCSKKKSYVSDLIKKGVPDEFRPLIWQLYCGAYDSAVKKHYHNYLLVDSPVEKAIRRDIARTFPKHDLFKDENGCGQESLFRVIKAYSIHDPEVGYCQGSAFIVGLLLMQMPELNAFAVLVQLMNDYRLREMYKPSMIELGVCMYQLEQLIADNLPELYTHFRTQSFAPSLYASAWFLTLFSTILPIPCATRVMDFYIVEGLQFIFKLALSILKFSADNLLKCDMESMVAFLQHEGPLAWDKYSTTIFENACSLKLNTKKMKKLAKEYMTMRSQEREEQIELRRLRTENGLLLQRLARLEELSLLCMRYELSRNRDYQTKGINYNEIKNDELLSTTVNQLQTDLVNSRFNEADAKKVLHELRCKLHELEESKSDQSLRSTEQIAVLKDELFGAKLRETELINQIEELKRRFDDLNSLWQTHLGKCKGVNNDTKRSSLWIGSLNSLDAHETNFKMKFSDRLLETRFVNQISSLKQQITDLTVQQELSDRRADRLDKRVTELLESRTAFQARERELTLELKQLEQKCADIEAKRKADGVMWRSREMEFKTQLAERKQGYLQLEYQYESLLTSQSLQSKTDNHELMLRKSSLDSDKILEMANNTSSTVEHIGSISNDNHNNNKNNANRFTFGSYLKFTQPNPSSNPSHSTVSTPRSTMDKKIVNNDTSYCPINDELYSMWKDLPPAVMTESIGPLEDLCLIPDDPMITSVYLNSSSSATSATTTTTTSPPSTPPSVVSNNHF
ncbi:putative ecotropic viral integration site [Schistosoma mansoni]|uniref:putative ecotropic viral integration site n=1 Tax=Schistosoma mansoni TaxID=6183 RepID=UPI00019B354C|nr:putative ecotropic viral integration site [Schistosoma mansoni]|eukprot:XP_018655616.1 putative ecotropic viral integration site [Schistosoma mansoni]